MTKNAPQITAADFSSAPLFDEGTLHLGPEGTPWAIVFMDGELELDGRVAHAVCNVRDHQIMLSTYAPRIAQLRALLHEVLHVAESQLGGGAALFSEHVIEHMAQTILQTLVSSKLISVTPDELEAYRIFDAFCMACVAEHIEVGDLGQHLRILRDGEPPEDVRVGGLPATSNVVSLGEEE